MKKLMVMLSAAAMAFGLFADVTYKTSFETGDDCVQDGVFTADDATWSGFTAPITLKKDDAKPACYGTGDLDRREEFNGLEDAHQYLPLETGKDTLNLAKGDVFLDQIVKFTGFEEEPTDFGEGTKIAVWMSAIEDDPDTTEVNEGETNLYVAVGCEAGTQNVKLICDVEPETWYRLTIKKLENPILAADGNKLGGFIIYINGEQVGYDPTTTALYPVDDLSSEAKSYAVAGQLFPAMVADETFANTFASVGYNGIGAIDDIVVDAAGPKFAQFVEGTVAPLPGSIYDLVLKSGDATIEVGEDGKFLAAPGAALTFIYTAKGGYFFKGGVLTKTFEDTAAKDKTFDFTSDLDAKIAVAKYDGAAGDVYTDSLNDAFANTLANVTLLADVSLTAADASIKVPATFKNAFDLNGKKIERLANSEYVMEIAAGAEMILVDTAETKGWIKSTPVAAGNTTNPASTIVVKGTLLLAGAQVFADYCCVKVDDYADGRGAFIMNSGRLEVISGFDGITFTVMNWGDTTIAGGTHKGNVQCWDYTGAPLGSPALLIAQGSEDDGCETLSFDPATVYLGAYDAGARPVITIADDIELAGELITEKGKDFGLKVVAAEADEGFYAYTLAEKTYVCEINEKGYETLDAAFEAATDGDEIELLADIETTRVDIDASKSVTLNMAGKKITLKTTEADDREQLIVWGGLNDTLQTGKLTITGEGEMDASDAEAGIAVWARFGDIDIKNGTYTVYGQGECVFARNFSKVTIEDGLFTNYATGPQCGDVLNAQNQESVLTIQVTGGSYSKDPAEGDDFLGPTFVAPGYASVKQESLWKVGAAIIATFKVEGDVYTAETNIVAFTPATPADPVVEGMKFTGWEPEIKEISASTEFVAQLEPIASGITINVTLGDGIASVTVGDKKITESGEVKLDEAGEVTITLTAVDTIKIPVFKVAKAEFGAQATPKTTTYTIADGDTFAFTVEEADVNDPEVSETQKKQAIIDAIDDDDPETREAAVAKVNQVVTTEETPAEGKVTASQLATYITGKGIQSSDLAASDYVVASVKLGTDTLIDKDTSVKVEKAEEATGNLEFAIKVAGKDVTSIDQVENFVELSGDLGDSEAWKTLPQSELKSAVKIEDGKLVITPVAGVDKLFLKVNIPQDAK